MGNAHGLVELHEHDDGLGVHRGLFRAQTLDAHLVELTLAAFLWTFGSEHGAGVHELDGGCPLRHQVMLHHSTDNAGRAFGTQGKTAFRLHRAAIEQLLQVLAGNGREHLLGNHVRCFADAAHEQLRLLEHGRLDGRVAVAAEDLCRRALELRPECRLVGQQVLRSFRGLDSHVRHPSFVQPARAIVAQAVLRLHLRENKGHRETGFRRSARQPPRGAPRQTGETSSERSTFTKASSGR